MKNINLKDLSRYKKVFLINSKHPFTIEKLNEDSCFIYINKIKGNAPNSYMFSWSEFKHGYYKRCKVSKEAFKFSSKLLKILRKDNLFFFKLLHFKYSKNLISLTFKKFVLENIYEYFFLFYCAKELKNKKNIVHIINTSQNFDLFEDIFKFFKDEKFKILQKKFLLFDLKIFFKNILLIFFYQFFAIFSSSNIIFNKHKVKFAARYFNTGFNLNTNPKINWIFKNVKKKNYQIICEQLPDDNFVKKLKKSKMNFNVNSNIRPIKSLNFNYIPKYLMSSLFFISVGLSSLFRNFLVIDFARQLIVSSIKWEKFTDILLIDKYISYNNYNFDHIVRNFFLRKYNTKTFHYKHTFAENIYEKQTDYNNYNYAYAFYDYEFHWSIISKRMSILDKSQSKKFIVNGPINAQYFEKKIKNQDNLICFFTSQLGTRDSICSKENHIKFLNFINEFSEIKKYKIILKPKYSVKRIKYLYPEIFKMIVKLKKKKNIKVIENINAEKFMFKASKIISMPFASTSIQGIYNDIPSYYLDLDKQFKNIFFKKNKIYFVNDEDIKKKLIEKKKKSKLILRIKKKIFKETLIQKKIPNFFT